MSDQAIGGLLEVLKYLLIETGILTIAFVSGYLASRYIERGLK